MSLNKTTSSSSRQTIIAAHYFLNVWLLQLIGSTSCLLMFSSPTCVLVHTRAAVLSDIQPSLVQLPFVFGPNVLFRITNLFVYVATNEAACCVVLFPTPAAEKCLWCQEWRCLLLLFANFGYGVILIHTRKWRMSCKPRPQPNTFSITWHYSHPAQSCLHLHLVFWVCSHQKTLDWVLWR